VANWATGIAASLLFFLPGTPLTWSHTLQACEAGISFFLGQVCIFAAIWRGDVSVTTPVLGTKVMLVAFLTGLLLGESIPLQWWFAVFLTAMATALLGWKPKSAALRMSENPEAGKNAALSMRLAFLAAGFYALADVLTQKWAPAVGFSRFVPVMFLANAVASLGLLPFFGYRLTGLPASTWRWLLPGGLLIAVQLLGFALTLAHYGHATLINVVYSSRGLWTVLLVWGIGHWFENRESKEMGNFVMAQRLCGSGLICAAIWLILSHPIT
jgi:drug/metabolite transporter (DMT)-like permease